VQRKFYLPTKNGTLYEPAPQHLDIKLEFVEKDYWIKIVEINSFTNPFPYKRLTIQSMVFAFDTILQHDREMFEEPTGWQTKAIAESPLVKDFSNLWKQLKEKYQTELSALAYRPIPDEKDVAKCFEELIKRIE